jgi:hypothetical protein
LKTYPAKETKELDEYGKSVRSTVVDAPEDPALIVTSIALKVYCCIPVVPVGPVFPV